MIQRQIARKQLQEKFSQRKICKCRGFIKAFTTIDYTFGVNTPNKTRVLLIDVEVDEIEVKHIWVECKKMNNYPQWRWVTFDANVGLYRKKNGALGYNIVNIKNIKLEDITKRDLNIKN